MRFEYKSVLFGLSTNDAMLAQKTLYLLILEPNRI